MRTIINVGLQVDMVKNRVIISCLLLLCTMFSYAQTLTISQPFEPLSNVTVLETYQRQFAKWEKSDMDDSFPYVLVRVGLDGSDAEKMQAKQVLGMYLGTQTPVEAVDRSSDDELLFLIPKRSRTIIITCGDGCARQTIMENANLESNRVYYGRVHYVPMTDFNPSVYLTRHLFQLFVTPQSALVEVMVNGRRELWPAVNGVASKVLAQGTYAYKVSSEQYYPKEGKFVVSPTSTALQVDLHPKFGWLSVDGTTDVYGAYVFAEHQTTGATSLIGIIPIEKAELATGPYTLIIQQEKYKESSTVVTIYEAEETEIYPTLEPNFSHVVLTAAEYAEIYIDGRKVGKGVWDGTLEYGSYLVETRQQGHFSAYTSITIAQGDANVSYALNNPKPKHGTLIVDGNPIDAYIWIDNIQSGTTPMVFNQILVGEHRIRISKDGYVDSNHVVAVEEGKDHVISYALQQTDTAQAMQTSLPNMLLADNVHVFNLKDVSFAMVKIQGGTFYMGASEEQFDEMNDNELPIHQVSISDFYMGQTEVTQALWKSVMGTNPSAFPSNVSNPVENVSWEDCQRFIRKLNQLTGQTFRFPTEAEWEYAARGARDTISYKYAGDSISTNVAWSMENSGGATHMVALKDPNQLGLYDMSGNVCEWCQDWYSNYSIQNQKDPKGPSEGAYKVYRGGGWSFMASYARVAQRNYHTPTFSNSNIGLRLAISSIAEEKPLVEPKEEVSSLLPSTTDSAGVVNVLGISFGMITIEGGTFKMGATPEQGNDAMGGERPVRDITLSDYRIGQTEVTQALWKRVMTTNPSADTTCLQNPVTNVSWQDCQSFITKLNEITGKHFRLPTEAEWEYAARGGKMTNHFKYAGSAVMNEVAWYNANSNAMLHPVAQKKPNELELYDMSGNVSEWCQDWYGTYEGNGLTNPQGPATGSYRVVRGGSVHTPARLNRVAYRNGYAIDDRHADLGFRLVEVLQDTAMASVKKLEIPMDKERLDFEVNGVSFTMIKVDSGSCLMGATSEHKDLAYDWEKPMHYVTLSDFFIGQSEVTQELWKAVMDSVPSRFQNDPTNPVENVSWEDCQLFIAKLNALTGATFRLPTEAEWEYAARGGKNAQRKLYAGSDNPDEVVWYRDNSLGSSHPVGLKQSNELGLYDMGGNVWEWCQDWYGAYSPISQINPVGPDSSTTNRRVVRGGSWAYDANNCRVTVRNGQVETDKKVDIGFRLAL